MSMIGPQTMCHPSLPGGATGAPDRIARRGVSAGGPVAAFMPGESRGVRSGTEFARKKKRLPRARQPGNRAWFPIAGQLR
jgi:hypothetical protein